MNIDEILSKLNGVRKTDTGAMARCPAHDDSNASLSIRHCNDGRILLNCFAGCSTEQVVKSLGIQMQDLMPPAARKPNTGKPAKSKQAVFRTADAAANFLARKMGKPTAIWKYRDAQGREVGWIARWDTREGKEIRPISLRDDGWVIGGMTEPRPLYQLQAVMASSGRVFVTEGEKAADAVRSIGLIATTSPHGSKSAGKADWSPLAGREVIILPDNDTAGTEYAEQVRRLLKQLKPAPRVISVDLPDLPEGGDFVEYLQARRAAVLSDKEIREEVEGYVDDLLDMAKRVGNAPAGEQDCEDEEPPPAEPFKPFPASILPEPIRSFVTSCAKAIGCDVCYVALPVLTALAALIGNTRRIQLKRGWTEPAIIWTAVVGYSGNQKTPAYKAAIGPIYEIEHRLSQQAREAQAGYEAELAEYDRALKQWQHSKGTSEPPEKPEPPKIKRLVIDDITIEALVPILQDNPRGVLHATDELRGWVASFDRYSPGGKAGVDEARWLSIHSGGTILVDRKTGNPRRLYVRSAAVSLYGGIQPGILNLAVGEEQRQSGLLARLLLAMPPRKPRQWTEAVIPEHVQKAYADVLERLFEVEFDRDSNGEICPRILKMTPEAKELWISFYNRHGVEHADLEDGDLSAAWSKLEGYAARLALVIHMTRWAAGDPSLCDPDQIDADSVLAGIELAEWFKYECRRIYEILAEEGEDKKQRQLLELIERKGGKVSSRDLMRCSRRFKTASDAEQALDQLVRVGMGSWEYAPPDPQGGRPTKVFQLAEDLMQSGLRSNTCRQNPPQKSRSEVLSASAPVGSPNEESLGSAPAVPGTASREPRAISLDPDHPTALDLLNPEQRARYGQARSTLPGLDPAAEHLIAWRAAILGDDGLPAEVVPLQPLPTPERGCLPDEPDSSKAVDAERSDI